MGCINQRMKAKTWVNTGLKDAQQIGGLAIDPTNENRVFAAVLGHPYEANMLKEAFTEQQMAAKLGKEFYTKMKIQERFK